MTACNIYSQLKPDRNNKIWLRLVRATFRYRLTHCYV